MEKEIIAMSTFLLVLGFATLLCSLIIIPFATAAPIALPQSSYVITESFTVPSGYMSHNITLSAGDKLHIWVDVIGGGNLDIDFHVMDETNYNAWKAGESASPQITYTNTTTLDCNWIVPHDGAWYFVYDNTLGSVSSKDVTTVVTSHWTETAYRRVTEYRPLLPSGFSYLSVAVLLGGVAVLLLGKTNKEASVSLQLGVQ